MVWIAFCLQLKQFDDLSILRFSKTHGFFIRTLLPYSARLKRVDKSLASVLMRLENKNILLMQQDDCRWRALYKRETGENPVRTRRCIRKRNLRKTTLP